LSTKSSVLILGIGNVLWADEGFGVRAVERLHRQYAFPDNVTVMDGGTQGIFLLPHVQNSSTLIILDAVDYGLSPGTLKLVEDDNVPSFMGAKKVSLHQAGFQEVLITAKMLGWTPQRILLVGLQPEMIEDYGGSLRPLIVSRIDDAITAVLDELQRLNVPVHRRVTTADELGPSALEQDLYEEGRPSELTACRTGDERFLSDWNA